ncbi:MAG: GNAT family N-acetyltransferase [Ilumatobacteraceae bacterium]|jgi:ribosomal-protein-alanine N-acetyltransferase|nr:GNAT family N-acetyltransferase [Ilumatobacteraceae bacterium]
MILTARLVLRRFTEADRRAFAALNADEQVMATIGPVMTRDQSDALLDRIEAAHDERGFGLWCVDLGGECIGFTGLSVPWFRDGVEVGWRIRSEHWGRGYATEAAAASLTDGFGRLGLHEVISFTAVTNVASRRVMEKLGMRRDPAADFEHPSLPEGHPLRPHVLYRLTAEQHAAGPA